MIIRAIKVTLMDITNNVQKFKKIGTHDGAILQELHCPIVLVCAKMSEFISWVLLVEGRFKLNVVDGGSCGNPGMSSGGGIIRDSQGRVLAGFAHFYEYTINTIVECRALLNGLWLCKLLGLRDLLVESDSSVVVGWLCSGICRYWFL